MMFLLGFFMITWSQNLNGMGNTDKIKWMCENFTCDILCAQECRWTLEKIEKIKHFWRGDLFFSLSSDKKAGVAVFIKPGVFDSAVEVYKDNQGRLLVLEVMAGNCKCRILNLYGPNSEGDRRVFFERCKRWTDDRSVVVGDWNFALARLDVGDNNKFTSNTSMSAVFKWMREYDLMDAWRVLNPVTRAYSRRQVVLGKLKQSRIDLCLLSADLVPTLNVCEYQFCTWSDHASLRVTLGEGSRQRNRGLWCFNSALLEDTFFKDKMKSFLSALCDESEFVVDIIEWWCSGLKIVRRSLNTPVLWIQTLFCNRVVWGGQCTRRQTLSSVSLPLTVSRSMSQE